MSIDCFKAFWRFGFWFLYMGWLCSGYSWLLMGGWWSLQNGHGWLASLCLLGGNWFWLQVYSMEINHITYLFLWLVFVCCMDLSDCKRELELLKFAKEGVLNAVRNFFKHNFVFIFHLVKLSYHCSWFKSRSLVSIWECDLNIFKPLKSITNQ